MYVEELVPQGGPRPNNIEITSSETTCKCGGNFEGNCNCNGNCSENCACKKPLIKTVLDAPEKVLSTSKKYATNENILKLSIILALGAATYILIAE